MIESTNGSVVTPCAKKKSQPRMNQGLSKVAIGVMRAVRVSFALLVLFLVSLYSEAAPIGESSPGHLVGTGIYDITAPFAGINFMGYARPKQTGHGIHQRLRARAFIIAESPEIPQVPWNEAKQGTLQRIMTSLRGKSSPDEPSLIEFADPNKAVCFVSADIGMGSDVLNMRVLRRLEELLPEQKGSNQRLCHLENLSISGTHTHSAPAGFLQYAIFQITSLGFSEEVLTVYAEGIAQAIKRAYDDLTVGSVAIAKGRLDDANINRSPSSYLLNPASERKEYVDQGDTDKDMVQLNLWTESNELAGVLNWFAVHGTSMNSTNKLVSGDNKGFASYLLEKEYSNGSLPGTGRFVGAFASTNLGDVSPNTAGARCIDSGEPCDFLTSACKGGAMHCIASGPGRTMAESTEIIGRKQYVLASRLSKMRGTVVDGEIRSRHSFIDMSKLSVRISNDTVVHTCPAALGYSFAAGTTDGPGDFSFTQGTNTSNPFWNVVSGFLSIPSRKQRRCHTPKPILLNVGQVNHPYKWEVNVVPISVFRIGTFYILNVPGEFTTMAGRRLRKAVRVLLEEHGIHDPTIVIAGLSNTYSHYITTQEEYGGQRYEAASTLFGPHTLAGYIQEFRRIVNDLFSHDKSMSGPPPKDKSHAQISLIPPVGIDTIGVWKSFGSVVKESRDTYFRGNESVAVTFRSANPRNNPRIEGTFLTIERLENDSKWKVIFNDGDWCTRFHWRGGLSKLESSFADIFWDIPAGTVPGIHRICHFGTRKSLIRFSEAVLRVIPTWMLDNAVGSVAVSLVIATTSFLSSRSKSVKHFLEGELRHLQHREFAGCTRSFLVAG